jgi:hypothetical protein
MNGRKETMKMALSEGRFKYLMEDGRIYNAIKFKKKQGFFRKTLPSSWLFTLLFYILVAALFIIITAIVVPSDMGALTGIISVLIIFVIPIVLLVIGIRNRLKYLKEKRIYDDCTNNGKDDISLIYDDYQKMEKEHLGI